MVAIYHNPRCRKSRETLEIIEKSGVEYKIVEYLKEVPSEKEIRDLLKKLDLRPEDLLRKSEKIYKEEYKGKQLSDKQWIGAMVKHPILIERPIVVRDQKAVIGRPPENAKELL